ncbi:MAG: hypothetical protein CMP48_25445 [Rickettsiales bacterium]|nr:hypothetical protein [Rickettsiales bacterium]
MHPKLFASKKAMMRSIRTIIQLYLCFAGLSALAQTQEVFYLNSKQNPAKDEDTLYIRHVVVDMDSLFQVEDYSFPDSTLSRKSTIRIKYFDAEGSEEKLFKSSKLPWSFLDSAIMPTHLYQGDYIDFHPNGNQKSSGNYDLNKPIGTFKQWYANGTLKSELLFKELLPEEQDYMVINYFDSLGKPLVTNGNGFYHEVKKGYKANGKISNGLKIGLWTGSFLNGMSTFKETYSDHGEFEGGTSVDSTGATFSYKAIKTTPQYIDGGIPGFYGFISKYIYYPFEARRNKIEGSVYVSFIVSKAGKTENVKTVKGIGYECDEVAERMIDMCDYFTPGRLRGQAIETQMMLPILFKL